ncbi:hypothetical protein BJF83_22305 [Nocardiopsis sp. CNR-923]|uniref:chaplin n=1 Tax=Nocardiopsis sp. CNR-923 TaxID=1904965 RepID=UPI0009616F65|nr:chaplin [Nocardiopsis sp. CNR-923]OLT25866.1 hypothetical protein BJF83_22305 [Nocardiopsis sp. CNR-923]
MRNTLRYPFATVLTAGLVVAPLTAALADSSTDGSGGVASGNQIIVPVDAAVDACGNAVAVGGLSQADCVEVVEALEEESASEGGASTDGSGGVASGNQIIVPVDAAIDICGNAVSVLGIAEGACMEQISDGGYGDDGDGGDDGDDGGDGNGDGDGGDGGEGGDDGNGDDDGGDGGGDDGRDDEGDTDSGSQSDGSSSTGGDPRPQADEQLAVTGTALGGLVAAGVAAIGAGFAGLYFARKRRAAGAADEV